MIKKGNFSSKFFTKDNVIYERDQQTGELYFLYPKRTTLKNRLHTDDMEFVDFINCCLQTDPDKRYAEHGLFNNW